MQRAQRAIDNPALTVAIHAANDLGKPVLVFFCLLSRHPAANLRHYAFMMQGLEDTSARLERMRIGFVLRTSGGPSPLPAFLRLCRQVRPAVVITDENPLRKSNGWRVAAAGSLSVPLISVDADVIVPSALLGNEQYAARTIRPRIMAELDRFLRPVHNPAVRIAWHSPAGLSSLDATSFAVTPKTVTIRRSMARAGCRRTCILANSVRILWRWPCAIPTLRARRATPSWNS